MGLFPFSQLVLLQICRFWSCLWLTHKWLWLHCWAAKSLKVLLPSLECWQICRWWHFEEWVGDVKLKLKKWQKPLINKMALTQEHFYNKSSFINTLPERRCHAPKKLLNERRSYEKTSSFSHHQIRMSWHKKSIVTNSNKEEIAKM